MLNRGQFTFYRSFWEAIKVLPKKDRLPILEAIISYALDGTEPSELTQSQLAFFSLVRPNLDTARRKAGGGSAKTSVEDNGKMPQRSLKDTDNKKKGEKEKENEKENKKENEIEGENDKRSNVEAAPAPSFGKSFTSFWEAYPSKIGRESAWEAWKALNPDAKTVAGILSGLDAWKVSEQWTDEGGRYIPRAAKFLSERHWESPPKECVKKGAVPYGASGKLGAEEMEAIRRILTEPDYGLRKPGEVASE